MSFNLSQQIVEATRPHTELMLGIDAAASGPRYGNPLDLGQDCWLVTHMSRLISKGSCAVVEKLDCNVSGARCAGALSC